MDLNNPKKQQQTFRQDDIQSDLQLLTNKQNQQRASHTSPHADEYQKALKDVPTLNFFSHSSPLDTIKITYHPEFFSPSLTSEVTGIGIKDRIFILEANISFFTLSISVHLSQQNFLKTNELHLVNKGSFGSIYSLGEHSVIKCIKFDNEKLESKKKTLRTALEEYCLYSIASTVKVGPKIVNSFGFNLLIYNDCIQFTIQKCQPFRITEKKELRQSLKLLHSFRIIHGDIKPDNIMYSQAYQRNVFIDFNCSSVIMEQVGHSSLSSFKGTLSYASPEMRKIWQDKKGLDFVDLYYNDLFALEKIQMAEDHFLMSASQQFQNRLSQTTKSLFAHIRLRFLIFLKKQEEVFSFLDKNKQILVPSQKLQIKIPRKALKHYQIKVFSVKNLQYTRIIEEIEKTMSLRVILNGSQGYEEIERILKAYFSFYISKKLKNGYSSNFEKLVTFTSQSSQVQQYIQHPWLVILGNQKQNLFASRSILNRIKAEGNKFQLKKLYYQFLSFDPSDEQIIQILEIMKKKLLLEESLSTQPIEVMEDIDRAFEKKNRKFIWKLNRFRSKRKNNWIFNLCLTLCLIKSVSETQSLFKFSLSTNLQSHAVKLQKMKRWKYPKKNILFLEIFLYHFCRILQNTVYPNTRELLKLQKIITKNPLTFEIRFGEWSQFCTSLRKAICQSRNKLWTHELLQYSKKQTQKKECFFRDSIMYQYNQKKISKQNPLGLYFQNKSKSQQLIENFAKIEETVWSEEDYLSKLSGIINCNIAFNAVSLIEFFKYFVKNTVKYFCTINFSEVSNPQTQTIIKNFNISFVTLHFRFFLDNRFDYLKQFMKWISQNSIKRTEEIQLKTMAFLLINTSDKKNKQKIMKEMSEAFSFCLFQIIESQQELIMYANYLQRQLFLGKEIKRQFNMKDCESHIVIDRMTFMKKCTFYSQQLMLFSLVAHGYYQSFISYLQMIAEFFDGQNYREVKEFQFLTLVIQQKRIFLQNLEEKEIKDFLSFYCSEVLEHQSLSGNFILWHISLLGELFWVWQDKNNKNLVPLITITYEKCLLAILKLSYRCSFVMRNRVRENMSAILEKFLKLLRSQQNSSSYSHAINPNLIYGLKKRKLRIYLLRNSLFPTSKGFGSIINKIVRNIPKIRENLLQKLRKYVKNKQSRLLPSMKICLLIQREFLREYFNQPTLQVQIFQK